ncbi:MAG: glutaredoxin family protein [Solirubrobacteraceae bacterium]
MAEIIVYTTDFCGYCTRVKSLLQARNLDFSEINLSRDPQGRIELVNKTGLMTVPQVLVDGKLVGGFAETIAAVESGRLDELLAA